MIDKLYNLPMFLRVFISAILGIFITCILIQPFTLAAFQYFEHGNDIWLRDFNILWGILRGPLLYPLALLVAAPLVLIAMIVSVIFKKSIKKNLAIWCVFAPVSIWIFVTTYFSLTGDNAYYKSHAFLENFIATITNAGNFLYLLGPIPPAIIFYFISSQKKPKVEDGSPD